MSSKTRRQLEAWIKEKRVAGRVLDIGGSQLPIKGRIQHEPDTIFDILDLEVPHELKQKPDIVWDLNYPAKGDIEHYDYAVCLEVSEYWWNPIVALKNINYLLKNGGRLFISFHFIYPVHNPVPLDYLRYSMEGACKLLHEAGFFIKELTPRTCDLPFLWEFFMHEVMRPAKNHHHEDIGVLIEAVKERDV